MIPKSDKLVKDETMACMKEKPCSKKEAKPCKTACGKIYVKKLNMLNEFIAVRLFEQESELALPEDKRFKNEGIVVGVGQGLPDGSGGRCESQLKIGDVVLVQDRNIITALSVAGGHYDNAKIVVLSERNIICKLDPVPYEVVE